MIRFHTFGEPRLSLANRDLELPAKALAIIAVLDDSPFNRADAQYLANLIWPDVDDRASARSLTQEVYTIRKRVGPNLLKRMGTLIQLESAGFQSDTKTLLKAAITNDLTLALDIYTGPFLDGFSGRIGEEFDDWRNGRGSFYRETLTGMFAKTLRRLHDLGQHEGVSTILIEAGTRLGFDDVYLTLRKRFQGDSKPAINSKDASFAASQTLETERVFGRSDIIDELKELWFAQSREHARVIAVTGPAGIGKTTIANVFLNTSVGRSSLNIRTRIYPSDRFTPYRTLAALVKAASAESIAELPAVLRSAIAEVIPEFQPSSPTPAVALNDEASRRRFFEAVAQLFRIMTSTQKHSLFVDDAQWVDEASIAGLSYLIRNIPRDSLHILVTERSGEGRFTRALLSDRIEVACVEVPELDRKTVDEMITVTRPEWARDERLRDGIWKVAGGHPILVARALTASAEMILHRAPLSTRYFENEIGAVSPQERQILDILATAGCPVDIDILKNLTGLNEVDITRTVDSLALYCRWAVNGRLTLRHDLLADTIRFLCPPHRRRLLHARLAAELKRCNAHPAELARHFDGAGNGKEAFVWSIQAGEAAEAVYAPSEAEHWYMCALKHANSESECATLWRRIADVSYKFGDLRKASNAIRRMDVSALSSHERLKYEWMKAECAFWSDTMTTKRRLECIRGFSEEAAIASDDAIMLRALHLEFKGLHLGLLGPHARTAKEIHRDIMRVVYRHRRTALGADGLRIAAISLAAFADARNAMRLVRVASAWAQKQNEVELMILSHADLATILYHNGKVLEAGIEASTAISIIESAGAVALKAYVSNVYGAILVEIGEYDKAEVVLQSGQRVCLDPQHPQTSLIATNRALVAFNRGDHNECLLRLEQPTVAGGWLSIVRNALAGLSLLEIGKVSEAFALAGSVEDALKSNLLMTGDVSYAMLLVARCAALRRREHDSDAILSRLKVEYEKRDAVCRLRLKICEAELFARRNPARAVSLCESVIHHSEAANLVATNLLAVRTRSRIRRSNRLIK